MTFQFQGRGTLLDVQSRPIEQVDYSFDLSITQGAIGALHSTDLHLPRLDVLRLYLEDGQHYLNIRVVPVRFHRLTKVCEYAIYLGPKQPDDPVNVVGELRRLRTHSRRPNQHDSLTQWIVDHNPA